MLVGCKNSCSNSIVKSISSPNGNYTAVAFIRDCGATTSFSPQVTLLKKGQKLNNSPGNVFIGNRSKFIDVQWENDNTLAITFNCSEKDIFKQEVNKYGINVTYKVLSQ